MLAVRPELHLQVLVGPVEEECLHHLVVPQPEVSLAWLPTRRRRVVIERSRDGDLDLPGAGSQGEGGRPLLQPLPVPGQTDGEGLPGWDEGEVR